MSNTTYEGVVENGQILLKEGVALPDKAKVYVTVLSPDKPRIPRIFSPRLVNRADAAKLRKEFVGLEADDTDEYEEV